MVMLHFNGRENGHVKEAVFIKKGGMHRHVTEEVSIMWGGGGGMLVREVASLNEGEWSFYRGGQFNGRKMVMLQRWSV